MVSLFPHSSCKTLISFPQIYASICEIDRILNEITGFKPAIQKAKFYHLSFQLVSRKRRNSMLLFALCETISVNARLFSPVIISPFIRATDGKRWKIYHLLHANVECYMLIHWIETIFVLSRSRRITPVIVVLRVILLSTHKQKIIYQLKNKREQWNFNGINELQKI